MKKNPTNLFFVALSLTSVFASLNTRAGLQSDSSTSKTDLKLEQKPFVSMIKPTGFFQSSLTGSRLSFYTMSSDKMLVERIYDLESESDLIDLKTQLLKILDLSQSDKLSQANEFSLSSDNIEIDFSKDDYQYSLLQMSKMTEKLIQSKYLTKNQNSIQLKATLHEMAQALKNNFKFPLQRHSFELALTPYYLYKMSKDNQVDPAPKGKNLEPVKVEDSSFWSKKLIVGLDLFSGQKKKAFVESSLGECKYDKAKSGYGRHTGIHIKCSDGEKYKLKFGEEKGTSVFNSRIYDAIGYNVLQSEHVDSISVVYDRKMITEFNSRKAMPITLKLAGAQVKEFNANSPKDFFHELKSVTLKNGTLINDIEIVKRKLFSKPYDYNASPETFEFNEEFENQIERFTFKSSSILEKTNDIEVGPWDYTSLGHKSLTEVRALFVLASWLGNHDMRWENNRLIAVNKKNQVTLKHFIADVGTSLGRSDSILNSTTGIINDMPWSVSFVHNISSLTEAKFSYLDSNFKDVIIMNGLVNYEDNPAFEKLNITDGQWMLGLISQISEKQILQALAASGFTAEEAKLALEKLLHRRNKMISHFYSSKVTDVKMPVELKNLLERRTNTKLNYDPAKEKLSVELSNGTIFEFKSGGRKIVNGVIL